MSENRHRRRSIARARACVPLFRLPSMQRPWFLPLALAALIVQFLIVQTHVHIPPDAHQVVGVSLPVAALASANEGDSANGTRPSHDPYPQGDDPSNCPMCQEIAHSGPVLPSAGPLLVLPATIDVPFVVLHKVVPSRLAASHTWRGRAPPQV